MSKDKPNPPAMPREGPARRRQGGRRVFSTAPRQLPLAEAECGGRGRCRGSDPAHVAAALPRRSWRQTVMRTNRVAPAQPAEVRCRRALAFVSGCGIPSQPVAGDASSLKPAPANITFTTTIIILSPAGGRHPARHLPSPSPLLLAAALPVPRARRPAAAPKPAPARLCRTGRRPATPGISTICSSSTPPTLLSSAPAFRRFAACLRSANF